MKVLLIGADGQLGWELRRCCPSGAVLSAVDYPEIDLRDNAGITEWINRIKPRWIINAAAYTAVDKAEQDPESANLLNHTAVARLAEAAGQNGARLVHISTDFIFNGRHGSPYRPDDAADPLSVYGMSKMKGELAAREILPEDLLLFRTAWLYSSHGANFVKTMLKLMRERECLNIIDDQVGTPTWAHGLAEVIWQAMKKDLTGIFHWTDAGVASWYDFAVAIQEDALAAGLLSRAIPVYPIPTAQYPTPAKRPLFSVLDKRSTREATGMQPVHWRVQLRKMLKEL